MEAAERKLLIEEIVKQIRNDSIKQDAQHLLSKRGLREAIPKFLAHPAFLLVIGFAITGLIGGWIANRWQRNEWDRQQPIQSKEWERQQLRLLDIHGIGLKYKIIDEMVQTGKIVYRTNRAHGLHCVGKEEGADAVERNQCHGPKNSVDS